MNPVLLPFFKNLPLEIAQTIFADNRVYHIGKLNCHNAITQQDLSLIEVCKNFSLPVTILNQCFEISKACEEESAIGKLHTDMDALISILNLSHMSVEERITYVKQMQVHAPKALFIDYELPERNLNYPMYFSLMLGEHFDLLRQDIALKLKRVQNEQKSQLATPKKQRENFKNYMLQGALEAFIFDLPHLLGKTPKCLKRSHLCMGGLGLFYCEW